MDFKLHRYLIPKMKPIITVVKPIFRIIKVPPIQKVFSELEKRGINPKELCVLEVFGGRGDLHAKYYSDKVCSLDVWEINQSFEFELHKNLPNANIKIVDSVVEMKTSTKSYNLIIIDNNIVSIPENRWEHFDIFPLIFRVAMRSTIIIINVISRMDQIPKADPDLVNEKHLASRATFYKTKHPETISFEEFKKTYSEIIALNGFQMEWCFFVKRIYSYYMVMSIKHVETDG